MRLRKCRLSQELNAEISKIAIDLANARVAGRTLLPRGKQFADFARQIAVIAAGLLDEPGTRLLRAVQSIEKNLFHCAPSVGLHRQ